MPTLNFADLSALIELIDDLPEDECHPKTLALRDKLVSMYYFMLMSDD